VIKKGGKEKRKDSQHPRLKQGKGKKEKEKAPYFLSCQDGGGKRVIKQSLG